MIIFSNYLFFSGGYIHLEGGRVEAHENADGTVLKLRNRAIREHGGHAYLTFPGICKRDQSVLNFREPNNTNLTRNGVHELDLRSITYVEVVYFINVYLYMVQIVFRGFPLYFKPGWASYFKGDQCGSEGVLGDRGAFLLQLMANRIDPLSPMITSHRDCSAPCCCMYPLVKGDPRDYVLVEDARKRFGPSLSERMTGRCVCCTTVSHGTESENCSCCEFCDDAQKEQFAHLDRIAESGLGLEMPGLQIKVRDVLEVPAIEPGDVNNNVNSTV